MAFRREKVKEQFNQVLPAVLQPGETVLAESYVISGPSPWLQGIVGLIALLFLGQRYYFMAVTQSRVIFMKMSMLSGRPKGPAWTDPRQAVAITDVHDSAVWKWFRYRRSDGKVIRMNFHTWWKDDFTAVVAQLGAPTAAMPPGGPPPAAAPPQAPPMAPPPPPPPAP